MFWIILLCSFVCAILAIYRHDKREQQHQHSDIADKVACATCNLPPTPESQFDYSKVYGVSFVELLLKEAAAVDAKTERLRELPGLIAQHTLTGIESYEQPAYYGQVWSHKDSGLVYVAVHDFEKSKLKWVESKFALAEGLVTEQAIVNAKPSQTLTVARQDVSIEPKQVVGRTFNFGCGCPVLLFDDGSEFVQHTVRCNQRQYAPPPEKIAFETEDHSIVWRDG